MIATERLRSMVTFLGPGELTPDASRLLLLLCDEAEETSVETVKVFEIDSALVKEAVRRLQVMSVEFGPPPDPSHVWENGTGQELADAIIYLLAMGGERGIDLSVPIMDRLQ